MTFTDAVRTCLREYITFSGRATRRAFFGVGVSYLAGAFAVFWSTDVATHGRGLKAAFAMLAYLTVFFVPFLSVAWRRFHDLDRPGYIAMIPFAILAFGVSLSLAESSLRPQEYAGIIGAIVAYGGFLLTGLVLLIWLAMPAKVGPNRYGPNPREVTA